MTRDEQDLLLTRLAELAEYFDKPQSDAQLLLYIRALDDLPFDDLMHASTVIVKTCTFFPKVAEIRKLIEGDPREQSQNAWIELVGEIRRVGWCGVPRLSEATHATMEGLWGSWRRLCETLPGEGPELLGWQKRWESAYGATSGRLDRGELITRDEAKQILAGIAASKPQQLSEADERAVPTVQERVSVAAQDSDQRRTRDGR